MPLSKLKEAPLNPFKRALTLATRSIACDSAAASAWPRITAISVLVGTRDGSGSRAIFPASPGGSLVKITSIALSAAIDRVVWVTARLNGSSGASLRRVSVMD